MKKTVVVTGATGFFGRYLVQALENDYHVCAVSRNHDKLKSIFPAESVSKIVVDLYDSESIIRECKNIGKHFDVHGLINNAYDFSEKTGFNTQKGTLENISVEMIQAALQSGVTAPLLFAQSIGNQMIEKSIKGSIINVSSMYSIVSPDRRLYQGKTTLNPVTYGIAKSGLNAMSRYMASFWGKHGIRVNSIAPGAYPNMEMESANATSDREFICRLEHKTALARVGHPNDLTGITRFLLSDSSSYITGQTICIDGGWTII